MIKTLRQSAFFLFSSSLFIISCSKTNQKGESSSTMHTSLIHHKYGLTQVTPEELKNVPIFSEELFRSNIIANGLTFSGKKPTSYLLATPAVRDQGQIGACTGFSGTEANEIVHYYSYTTVPAPPTLTVANALATAVNTKFLTPTNYFGVDGSLAPLFLYYVERVLIQKQKITVDNGANMINIGEALQGLSNNTGTGKALTSGSNTFAGESTEDLYPYPITLDGDGYNEATSSSTQYKTAPSAAAIANAPKFNLAAQSGTTGSTGTTAHGYYLITSSGDTTEVNNVKTAILNNKPVLFGFNVYDNASYTIFEGLNTTSYIYNPLVAKTKNGTTTYVLNTKLTLEGGHAVPLIGYVDDGTASTSATGGGYFVVQNSWGTPWGYNGDFLLPYSVLRNTTVCANGNLYVLIP